MNSDRYCRCGQPIDPREGINYCCRCGKRFYNGSWSGKSGNANWNSDWMQAIKTFAVNHPVLFSAGIIGAGVGALMVSPVVMHAGVALTIAGLIVAAAGWYAAVKSQGDEPQYDRQPNAGIRIGILMIAGGALVYLLSYLLVAVGGVSIVAGASISTYKGVRMLKKSKEVRLVVGKCCQAVPKAGRRMKELLSQLYRKLRPRVPRREGDPKKGES